MKLVGRTLILPSLVVGCAWFVVALDGRLATWGPDVDLTFEYPETCSVHGLATIEGTVPMVDGCLSMERPEYEAALVSEFPNSNLTVTSDWDNEDALVRYCAECRNAELAWEWSEPTPNTPMQTDAAPPRR